MNISLFELSAPQFILALTNLKNILKKAAHYAEVKKVDMAVLFETRLIPDQLPLGKQVQITCDSAKFCISRLTGLEPPVFEDNEKTLDEFLVRIDNTIAFLQTVKAEQFNNYESKKVSFYWIPGKHLNGKDYLVQHAIPNFYFHLTTAYSILRNCGVELGKTDYLGAENWQND